MTVAGDFRPRFIDEGDHGLVPSLVFFTALAGMFVVYVATAPPAPEPSLDRAPQAVQDKVYWKIPTIVEAQAPSPSVVPGPRPESAPAARPAPRVAETTPASSGRNALMEVVTHGPAYRERWSPERVGLIVKGLPPAISDDAPSGGTRHDSAPMPGDRRFEPGAPRVPDAPLTPLPDIRPSVVILPEPAPPADLPTTCPAEAIRAVVTASRGQLKGCYEGELRKNPSLSGRLTMSWMVADGAVLRADVADNDTGSASFGACVQRRVEGWRFAKGCSGEVEWGFLFAPR